MISHNATAAVEVPSLRTRTSRTYLTSQGYQAQISVDSLNYRDPTGAWQPIDDTLVPATTGGFAYQNHANAYPLLLPPSLSSPVTVITGTETLAFGLVGAQGAVAVTGNVGTDANALPGVSVSDAAEPDAMKESLILVGPTAPSAYTFTLSLRPGLTAQPTANGGVSVLAAGGRPAFILPPPVVTDSSHIAAGISQTASFTLGSDGATLTQHVDPTWLASPARVWPIVIDPSVQLIDREACVIQSGSGATTSDCSSPTLDVGYDGSITLVTYRTLLQFNPGQSVPHGVTITNATLSVISYGLYGQTGNGSCFVDAMQVTQPWTSGVTWDTTDGSTPWSTAGGSFGATPVASRTFCPSPYSYPNDYWNVTSLVQAWIEGAAPDDGILLKTQDETASDVHEFDNGSFDNGQASGAATYYTYVPSGTLIDQRAPTGTDYYLFDGLGNVVALTDSTGAGGPLLPGPGDARDDPRGGVGALHRLRGE